MKIKNAIVITVLCAYTLSAFSQIPAYKNTSLPIEQRVDDLIGRMTPEEKIGQMMNNAPGIDRLDIPAYNWWNECLHGVARAGWATVFPQAIGLAATFDKDAMFKTATVISDEARAKYHHSVSQNSKVIPQYYGLTFWTPNINIFRDPRWGRGQETYGEDPYLTGEMGVAFVKGLQGDDNKYLKTVATAKHYAVHSGPEYNRHAFDVRPDMYDLWDTYLPAFKKLIKTGEAYSVMCAYNRFEGEPCCGSDELLVDILRNKWGFEGYVVSDCGAVDNFYKTHKTSKDAAEASAQATIAGTDLECGRSYKALLEAVQRGDIAEAEIDIAVKRLFTARMKLGMFDPDDMVKYSQIPFSTVCSPESRQQSLEMARKSIVLLKNEQETLPLKKNIKTIAVLGPNADNPTCLLANYNGSPSYIVTPLDGIRQKLGNKAKIIYDQAVGLTDDTISISVNILNQLKIDGKTGYKSEIFYNNKFEGEPALTRYVKEINFFGTKQHEQMKGLQSGKLSVRWTTTYAPQADGHVCFEMTGDDSGFRLFVDDQNVMNRWGYQEARVEQYRLDVKAGLKYKLRFEFYQDNEGGGVSLATVDRQKSNPESLKNKIKDADVIVFVGGISPSLEGEEMPVSVPGFNKGDRTDINLPKVQTEMLRELKSAGKPIIFVMLTGSALAINWENENLPAILNAWYGGQDTGTALADILFGDYNPAGRLPVTFYKNTSDLPPYEDYSMQNRTYRYFTGETLYKFGHGLSYTTFTYKNLSTPQEINIGKTAEISVEVTNSGLKDGDEVVQLYLSHPEMKSTTPIHSLQGFQRIFLKAGETCKVTFTLTPENMAVVDALAQYGIIPGKMIISVGGCQPEEKAFEKQQTVQGFSVLKGKKLILE
ncbi:MAG: glycoside hydrolase family 3 C-terminal domain-containing protein [Dysgonamonadaceae bacterium]|jgi:beta-glucosidase|nr:glycoside hydrolase family 3 C-terminal domain-containing protein [Dysgonamonadaceae bacterium]